MSDDPYQEYEDRMLLEEHAAHPERFHRTNQMKQRFINHIQSIADPALRATCNEILLLDNFLTWPASLSHHHAYEGGLLAHTVEVVDIALGIEQISNGVGDGNPFDRESSFDILIAAALWHDVMKTEEYKLNPVFVDTFPKGTRCIIGSKGTWTETPYTHQIHHIQGSAIEFTVAARKHGVSPATIDAITHCILAHHGRREWGSPVEPQTLEALILHQADMLSARYGATKEVKP